MAMLALPAGNAPGVLEFLKTLPKGSVVAQLEDGSIVVCRDVDEADRRILESRGDKPHAAVRRKQAATAQPAA